MPPGKLSPLGRRTQSLLGTEFSVVKALNTGRLEPWSNWGAGQGLSPENTGSGRTRSSGGTRLPE